MSTTHDTDSLTPDQVAAFMVATRESLSLPFGAQLMCAASDMLGARWSIYGTFGIGGESAWISGDGPTLAEAMESFRSQYPATPEARADRLRKQAAELIAKADALTPKEAA